MVVAMASAGGKMLSAEERKRQRELEDARKAGLAAPEVRGDGEGCDMSALQATSLIHCPLVPCSSTKRATLLTRTSPVFS